VRALVTAKEAGNAAFKAGGWADAHRHYSAALAHLTPDAGNGSFFAQCFSNRCWVLSSFDAFPAWM
jgi:hypothetical protein